MPITTSLADLLPHSRGQDCRADLGSESVLHHRRFDGSIVSVIYSQYPRVCLAVNEKAGTIVGVAAAACGGLIWETRNSRSGF